MYSASAATTPESISPPTCPLVLVVEDVQATRDRLTRVLRGGGYEVVAARDGGDALRSLAVTPHVDAIVLDLVMPSMNGWEFRDVQLRDPGLAVIPTLVLTARDLKDHERYALRIGSATLIHKPFEDSQLIDCLSRIVPARPATVADNGRWLSRHGTPLLWSRRGGVACEAHAPGRETAEWVTEGWAWIPRFAGKSKIEYSCQQCNGGPIAHRSHRQAPSAVA